jgi:hypothetical protein
VSPGTKEIKRNGISNGSKILEVYTTPMIIPINERGY